MQGSRGSVYCASEPDPAGVGAVHESEGVGLGVVSTNASHMDGQHNSGSLYSVASAPPAPLPLSLAQLDVKQMESLYVPTPSPCNSHMASPARRPATLSLDEPCCPRTLHASLLAELEEDDNENLLTVSSITARPLIAKSHELRSNRKHQQQRRRPVPNRRSKQLVKDRDTSTITTESSGAGTAAAEPPDGGYGWFIVFGAFSVQFWVAGLVKSYGVLYVEIMETFPSSTATVASWIPAILSALCLVLAPLSSALCQRFSCRSVVFVGGIFCSLGMILSYFATNLLHLLFTFGILTGIGGGLSTTPGIVIVSQYFDKHRALANGICVSGTAAGSFVLPILIKHLAENCGFHGTLLILGGCMLHVCVSAMLYRPLSAHVEQAEAKKTIVEDTNANATGMLTTSTYLDTHEATDTELNDKFIEHLFLEECKNHLIYYANKQSSELSAQVCSVIKLNNVYFEAQDKSAQESDDEVKDIIGETTFIKPMKKVRSSGLLHSVEDLSTDSTWVYRKHSGTDSNRGSRRRRNVFANDETISKIQAHLEKPLSPPSVVSRGLSKSMEIPTPVSKLSELKQQPPADSQLQLEDDDDDEDDDGVDEDEQLKRSCCARIEVYLDLSLLQDPSFILMCLSVTLMSVGCPYMLYYLPAHVISIGYNKSEAGYLVAISAVLDLCGRLGLGWLSDLQLFDRKRTYTLCILGAGLAVLTIPFAKTLILVGLSAAVYGLCLGSWYVLMPVLLADVFGTDRISSSYGLVRMFQSIGAISVPPLAGLLRDISGDYEICFYCMGSCMVLGCLPLLVWIILESRNHRLFVQRVEDEEEED
ncbi:Sln, partial [Drosophila busckii]